MFSTRKLVTIAAVAAVATSGITFAQTMPDHHSMGPDQQQMMQSGPHPMGPSQMQEMMRQHQRTMGARPGMHATSTTPTMPGQDAFAAIQENGQILDADPKTDWSKIDLEALRQHLIDMNDVTLRSVAAPKEIDVCLVLSLTG